MKIKSAFFVVALSALAASSSAMAGEETEVLTTVSTLSRAQVQADAAAWRAAGLANASRGEQTPDVYSAEYRGKVAKYRQALAANKAQGTGSAG